MPINRRQFIKRSAGAVSVGLVMPKLFLSDALAQGPINPNRRILVVIQQAGGNDGLNTVIPYTDSRYQSLRPTLAFKEADLKTAQGVSTVLGNAPFGFHPALAEMKELYDAGKVAPILGVGYPSANLSHFLSQDIYHTANIAGGAGDGWLGKYADQKLVGQSSLSAVSVGGGSLPKTFFADKVVVPNISSFANYTYQTDQRNAGDRNNQLNTFHSTNRRDFQADSFLKVIADTGVDGADGAAALQTAIAGYSSPVTYPANNPLAAGLKMTAQIATTISAANLLYVSIGGWDHHSEEIGDNQNPTNKLVGQHNTLLGYVSQGIKAFYDDMAAHGLADNLVIMTWTEFGRRPNENASHGTDHGTANVMFVVGNPVHGGKIYGEQPSLETLALDNAGNMKFTLDFRSVYATILDRWLGADSKSILGGSFENIGFLG